MSKGDRIVLLKHKLTAAFNIFTHDSMDITQDIYNTFCVVHKIVKK